MLTILAALLAGSIAGLGRVVAVGFQSVAAIAFLAALAAALCGVYPFEGVGFDLNDPEAIARYKAVALKSKLCWAPPRYFGHAGRLRRGDRRRRLGPVVPAAVGVDPAAPLPAETVALP